MINRYLKKATTVFMLCILIISVFLPYCSHVHAEDAVWTADDFVYENDTVCGLSKKGLEKLKTSNGHIILPSVNSSGQAVSKVASFAFTPDKSKAIEEYTGRTGINGKIDDLDVDGNQIQNIGENFSNNLIKEVTIPDSYTYVGQDAFSFNKSLSAVHLGSSLSYLSDYAFGHCQLNDLTLPSSLSKLGDMAFFDNRIQGNLIIPDSLKDLGERSFKNNKLESVTFGNSAVTEIKEATFEDNNIRTAYLSNNINKISPDAFGANPGESKYGYFVVLLTPDNKNPNKLQKQGNFLIDPTEDDSTTPLDIDYKNWTEKDFTYDNNTVTGFSDIGKIKIKENKNLVIPDSHNGIPIKKIGKNAFRNVDLSGDTLKKYDIESVVIPAGVEEIGSFAFQSNKISELLFEVDAPLKKIEEGAFMNNQIEMLSLPTGLEYIGDAAFHMNKIDVVLIPRDLNYLGRSAFRQNNLTFLGAEQGCKLESIGEMAFAENHLTSADLSNATNLHTIEVQAFAKNELSDITFSDKLTKIGSEAFVSNNFENFKGTSSLKEIVFNAFNNNPGNAKYNKVLVTLPDNVKTHSIADGDNFIVAPNLLVKNRDDIRKIVKKLENTDTKNLSDNMKEEIKNLIKEGQSLLSKENLSQGEAQSYKFRATFFLKRIELDKAIVASEKALASRGKENDKRLLKEKTDYAKLHFNNAAWSDEKIDRTTHELHLLTDLVLGRGDMGKATMVQGVHLLKSSLPIPEYYIGVNVYFNSEGKILYVNDRSYSIGENQKDEYGNPIVNVDEDNEGYHQLAIETLSDYEGITAFDITTNTVDSIGKIREIPKAKDHRNGIYLAIQDACKDYLSHHKDNRNNKNDKINEIKPDKKDGNHTSNHINRANTDLTVKNPHTGDIANIYIWFSISIVIIVSLIFTLRLKKRNIA